MTASVLLDTSFLISLVDQCRANHKTAAQYYRLMIEEQIPMYFSAIAAAEFSIKQPITDLPLKNFRPIPFNVPHALVAGRLWSQLWSRADGDQRHVARDDLKLIAQACHDQIPFILTEDASTLRRHCERLNSLGDSRTRAVVLNQGFDPCAFREDGQRGLAL